MTPLELYEENQALIWFVLKKYFPSLSKDEDITQVCKIGLWQACVAFNSEKGKFSTFAVKGIFMAVRRYIRDCCKPQIATIPLDEFVAPNTHLLRSETTGREDEHPALEDMMARLTPTQRLIVTMRSAELSVYDIGEAIGCSPQYVSQEIGRARKTIERFLR